MVPAEERASRQLMSVAPMMDWTDMYFRQLARLISKHTWLYTEMVVVGTRPSSSSVFNVRKNRHGCTLRRL